jgi:hypothetical protein
VGRADVEHHPDPGRGDLGEVGDVSDAASPHLHDEEARVGGHPADGERDADLGVVGADRGHGRPGRGEDRAEEVLGARLAGRPGDADDLETGDAAHHLAGQHPERRLGVVDDDAGDPVDRAAHQGRDRAALDGAADEVVAVGVLADPGDVEAALGGLPGVGDDRAVDDDGIRVDAGGDVEAPTGGGGDLGERQRDHAAPSAACRRSASASSSRSSNGCTTPPTS